METLGPMVLPGDVIDPAVVLTRQPPVDSFRLGPGLRLSLQSGIASDSTPSLTAVAAGQVVAVQKKNPKTSKSQSPLFYLADVSSGGRYCPRQGDLVIGQVDRTTADHALVALASHDAAPHRAVLPVLSFAGATRKNRPDLHPGTLVYARVALAGNHVETELECVDPNTGKSDGLGPLVGGMLFPVSLALARRLLMPSSKKTAGLILLDELAAAGLAFETAVGRNGRVWVQSADVRTVVVVGRALAALDAEPLDLAQQKALARKLVRG